MKKIIFTLLASVSLFGADHNLYNYSIGIVGGYTINSSESRLDNDLSWGLRYHYNRATVEGSIDIDAIQVTFDYIEDNIYQNSSKRIVDGKSNIYRLGANAVWYIENDSDFTPYALTGLGLQFFKESAAKDSNNALLATVGVGVEYQLRGDFSTVVEAKRVFAGDDSSYFLVNAGLKYSFGQNY